MEQVQVFVNGRLRWFPSKVTRAQVVERMGEPPGFLVVRQSKDDRQPDKMMPLDDEFEIVRGDYLYTIPRYVNGG